MSWVKECLKQQAELSSPPRPVVPASPPPPPPTWKAVWDYLAKVVTDDVKVFNSAGGSSYSVSFNDQFIQVIPAQPPISTATFFLEGGVIHVICPPPAEGIGRNGRFAIRDEHIVLSGEFVGEPKPPTTPMTPEQFSEQILRPLLFPAQNIGATDGGFQVRVP
jgi:hypothetical protein